MTDFQDEVKHISNDVVGTVIAIYEINGIEYVDVRADERIYYQSPAANWVTTVPVDE